MMDEDFVKWIKPECKEVFFCESGHELPVFHLRRSGHHQVSRVDIIAKSKGGAWIAIELEDGDEFGKITKGIAQLEDFYNTIKEGWGKLEVKGRKIKPKYFFLGTQYSENGFIYKNDKRVIQTGGYSPKSPLNKENWTSFVLIRAMWRLCLREEFSKTSPEAVSSMSIITKGHGDYPQVVLNGKTKIRLKNLK